MLLAGGEPLQRKGPIGSASWPLGGSSCSRQVIPEHFARAVALALLVLERVIARILAGSLPRSVDVHFLNFARGQDLRAASVALPTSISLKLLAAYAKGPPHIGGGPYNGLIEAPALSDALLGCRTCNKAPTSLAPSTPCMSPRCQLDAPSTSQEAPKQPEDLGVVVVVRIWRLSVRV